MPTTIFVRLALVLGLGWGLPGAHAARAQSQAQDAEALNALYGDFAAPDLTAPTLLGVNASQVSKPANVKAFAASLIGAAASFPEKGKGLGIEIAPAQFFQRPVWKASDPSQNNQRRLAESLKAYANPWNRIGRSLTLSGAQVGTDSTAKVAAGAAIALLDQTDPLLNRAYIERVAQGLAGQLDASQFIALRETHNNSMATRRQQVYATANLYRLDNTWTNEQRAAARPLKDRLEALLAKEPLLGLLPESPAVALLPPDSFAASQATAFDQFKADLQQEPSLTTAQRDALVQEIADELVLLKAQYQLYYDLQKLVSASTLGILKMAREEFDRTLWNASIVQVGGGWTWSSPSSVFGTLRPQSGGGFLRAALRPARPAWATNQRDHPVGYFLYRHTQLVLNVQYQNYHPYATRLPTAARTAADSLSSRFWGGARLLVGGAYLRLSLEGSVQHLAYSQLAQDAATAASKSLPGWLSTATIGAEVRLVEKIWLEFAIGTAKPSGRASQLLALSSLKYALRNSQRFKTN